MSQACHRFWKCYKPPRFAHFAKWIPRNCQAKPHLGNVLRATTACTFSTSGPNMVCFVHFDLEMCFAPQPSKSGPRMVCFVHFDLEMCFTPHGVHFFIFHLPWWLCIRRFSEPTFRTSEATNQWKNAVFRDVATFSRTCVFCLLTWLFLFSDLLSSLLFCFFICPYCRKFDF